MTEQGSAIAYLRAIIDGSVDGVIAIDVAGHPVMWNEQYLSMWGLSRELFEHGAPEERLKIMSAFARDPAIVFSRHSDIISHPGEFLRFDVTLASGGVLEGSASPVVSDDGTRIGQLITFRDVTEHRSAQEQRNFLAQHDPLTGFLNRGALYERIDHLLAVAKPDGVHLSCGLISLDLPCFTAIVEQHGYRFGDRLLAAIADRLDQTVGKDATIARHADAEFIIHAPNTAQPELHDLASRGVQSLTDPIAIENESFALTAHAGITMLPQPDMSLDELVGQAAIARRHAMSTGTDVVFFSESFGREVAERLAFERDLRSAIERDEFFLVYQPFFDLNTGAVVACEALLRWNRGGTEIVPPMDFIPLAERTGLIVEIGEWVLRKASEQTKLWQSASATPIPVSVNISARQLAEPDFDQVVARVLHETDLAPHLLQLELTETMSIHDTSHAADLIERILSMGVRVSLDDYGTGYTNLSYLKKFKFVTLKVDRSFTQGLGESTSANLLMEAAIAIARKVGLTLLAEGVETEEQLEFLRQAGADQVQGFLLAPPTDASEVTKFFSGYPALTP